MLPMTPQKKKTLLASARNHQARGDLEQAKQAWQRLALAEPGFVEGQVQLSNVAFETGDSAGALAALERALQLAPNEPKLWAHAATRFQALGKVDKALAAYDTAARLAPKDLHARVNKATLLQSLGRFKEAEAAFRKLLDKNPHESEIMRLMIATKKMKPGDPLIRKVSQLWSHPRLSEAGRMHLGFALGKIMDDTGQKDKVFGFLDIGNSLQRKAAPFDARARHLEWQSYLDAQATDTYDPIRPAGDMRPVFVTGMPRSGTTLVEQIIASHSQATAGGEMGHALKLAVRHFGSPGKMTRLNDLSEKQLTRWADDYGRLVARDTQAKQGVVTDKSIQSHMIFGLIHRGLPGARIIVVHRDPRDIALSIYRNFFKIGTHRYANDLADIAQAIQDFRASVSHWKGRLPGVIHEVRYEDLVADPEPRARALIAATGLDWEDACLRFHEAKGAVQTLSLAQVRQPIHAGRREAWRAFEKDLQPFIEAWGDTPWD